MCAVKYLRTLMMAAWLAAITPAAASIMYEYESECSSNCAAVGLQLGDLFVGSVTVLDAAVYPFAFITTTDVESFNMTFGTLSFGLSELTEFQAIFNESATDFLGFLAIMTGEASAALVLNDLVNIVLFDSGGRIEEIGGEDGDLREDDDVRAVSEPGTLSLLFLAIAGLRVSRHHRTPRL